MAAFSPRLSSRLVAEIERADRGTVPIAEISRRVGAAADRLGLPRPSYERIRQLVHEQRCLRRAAPTTGEVVLDVLTRSRPPVALLDQAAGVPQPRRTSTTK